MEWIFGLCCLTTTSKLSFWMMKLPLCTIVHSLFHSSTIWQYMLATLKSLEDKCHDDTVICFLGLGLKTIGRNDTMMKGYWFFRWIRGHQNIEQWHRDEGVKCSMIWHWTKGLSKLSTWSVLRNDQLEILKALADRKDATWQKWFGVKWIFLRKLYQDILSRPPKTSPFQKERLIFQSHFSGWELLVFHGTMPAWPHYINGGSL